jgi:hypothetical protein
MADRPLFFAVTEVRKNSKQDAKQGPKCMFVSQFPMFRRVGRMGMKRPEQQLQKCVFEHFRLRGAPRVMAFHCPNGGWRSRVEGAILKAMGTVPGIPDVCVIRDGRAYFLELKCEGGRITRAQRECHRELVRAGAIVGVAVGIDEALDWLESHGLLRGRRV